MTNIPSLTQQQLELLRLAKKHSDMNIQLSYETTCVEDNKPIIDHPPFIQELIDANLIQVQLQGMRVKASEFQKESWTKFCDGIDYPSSKDWELWRRRFISQHKEVISSIMLPGKRFEEFSQVWEREISIQATQPSSP